jgi:stress-induced morphogen
MPMPAQDILTLIHQAFPDAQIELKDLAGDQDHYALYITAEVFRGKTRVQQHQLVYQALNGKMGGELHALAVHTKIPN